MARECKGIPENGDLGLWKVPRSEEDIRKGTSAVTGPNSISPWPSGPPGSVSGMFSKKTSNLVIVAGSGSHGHKACQV